MVSNWGRELTVTSDIEHAQLRQDALVDGVDDDLEEADREQLEGGHFTEKRSKGDQHRRSSEVGLQQVVDRNLRFLRGSQGRERRSGACCQRVAPRRVGRASAN